MIYSRFQKERVITETLMDSKLAATEQCLYERIVQVIRDQFSSLGIGSTKPVVHGENQVMPRQLVNQQTSGNSNSIYQVMQR